VDAHYNPIAAWDDGDELLLRITENSSKITLSPSAQSSIAIPIPFFQSLTVQNRYPSFAFQGDQPVFLGVNQDDNEPAPILRTNAAWAEAPSVRAILGI
jgi:hypothetical protein